MKTNVDAVEGGGGGSYEPEIIPNVIELDTPSPIIHMSPRRCVDKMFFLVRIKKTALTLF